MAWAVGWLNWTPVAMAGSRLTKTFLSRAAIIEYIKFASKEAIPRAIPTVFRERAVAVAGGLRARSFPRSKPSNGMVICCGAWIAGAETRSRASCAAADRVGTRAFHWDNHHRGPRSPRQLAASNLENCRCSDPVCFWVVPSLSLPSPELGRDASWFWRFDALVLYHGI